MAIQPSQTDNDRSTPIKRIRWATHRKPGASGQKKRLSILDRFHKGAGSAEKKRHEGRTNDLGPIREDLEDSDGFGQEKARRRIFFNVPLPDDAKDEEGRPITTFNRNKIRTSRYTPLSFVPKDLYYQFHNIANIYFLFLIILAIFPIFGASNPGLNAVPLIFIIVITAIKDAIEDWRRTVLDNELNNSPLHRLCGIENVNVAEDNISMWRRTKKATTRGFISLYRLLMKRRGKSNNGKGYAERALDEPRHSIESIRPTPRTSMATSRTSFRSIQSDRGQEVIQMTPVPSPENRDDRRLGASNLDISDRPDTSFSYERDDSTLEALNGKAPMEVRTKEAQDLPPKRMFGNLINPAKQAPNKATFKKDYWKSLQVGDFIRIYNEDSIPADIVILSTSDPDGACYVETKNLDGETNLKVRQALRSGQKIRHARDCERTEFVIESEHPQPNLYSYSGVAKWTQKNPKISKDPGHDMAEPISINNLLLRGCSLRNTEWVLGVVVFTGRETKIMLNAGIVPSKRSRITRELNYNVIYNFIILVIMCLISGVVNGATYKKTDASFVYFEYGLIGGTPDLNGFITFWTTIILFQNLVPISLYISIEIIKVAQAFFIYSDTEMYYEKLDYPCTPKSWNISDDLGQIEYIFSDKTGTLTQNCMEFRKCSINGVPYGEAYTEAEAGLQRRQGINVEVEGAKVREQIARDRVKMLKDLREIHDNPYLHDDELTFVAPDFVNDLAGASGTEQRNANEHFMLALALCHTVITERTPGDPPTIEFKAQSPDEAALVATARDTGFTVLGRTNDGIILNVMGKDIEYEILNTLEFNSTRKRMSAIVRMPNGKIILFCKGADSIIYSRLKRGEQPQLRKDTADHLEMFAREGLRTLCIAQKEISEEEYRRWNKDHDQAAAAVQDREEKLEEISDAIEKDLTLLGGTAIEDRLQDGVPDTIALLGEAGIKLWVLTGDKVETAINIGFSCNLLNNDMELILLKIEDETLESAEAELDKHLKSFNITGSDQELKAARKNHEPPGPTHAIIIDGDSLKLVLDDQLRQKFLLLCKQCRSVLCCRVSPAQKAAVVRLVKNGLDVMTLAIGDGANDVAMIQEADIGVGIAGEEGRQAVMTADYAIGQFRFLQRLLLVHGRWSYRRLGEFIANFFYKNIVWTFILFWYQIYTNFDGTYLFEYTYILLFNLAFTSLPVIFLGILDQDVNDKVSLAVPQLYSRGIERKEWTQLKFWMYMIDGLYQSLICFFMPYLLFSPALFNTESGRGVGDRERVGVYSANVAIFVINTYILINTYRWDWLMLVLVAFSILLVWFWTGVYGAFTSSDYFYKAAPQVYGTLAFWAVTLLVAILCLAPRFAAKAIQKIYFPRDVDIIREQVRQGKYTHLDGKTKAITNSKDKGSSATSSDLSSPIDAHAVMEDDERPIYPPSNGPSSTTHGPHSNNGSDETQYAANRMSLEPPYRPSLDRPRPSFDRIRTSMDRVRPSYEASNDFTSAALLTRMESSHSQDMSASRSRSNLGISTLR